MTIEFEHLSPYVSLTAFDHEGGELAEKGNALIDILNGFTEKDLDKPGFLDRQLTTDGMLTTQHADTEFGFVAYEERRRPSWYNGNELEDCINHFILFAQQGDHFALVFSDNGMRERMVVRVIEAGDGVLSALQLLGSAHVNAAFVGREVKTLWLSGTHRRTTTKADSKILSGLELESALNPLEDQSYFYSSVRTAFPYDEDGGIPGSKIVGSNPTKSRVWLGPTRDWESFAEFVDKLLRRIAATDGEADAGTGSALPILAQPVESVGDAKSPYDLAIIVPEVLYSDYQNDADDAWLHEFQDAARFEITSDGDIADFTASVSWGDIPYGRIAYRFADRPKGGVLLETEVLDWNDDELRSEEVQKICRKADFLTAYYDSSHTFARGSFYQTRFRDAQFTDWKWVDLGGFEVKAEKPLTGPNNRTLDVEGMGEASDTSLFGYTVKKWFELQGHDAPVGWLACDDGSMESADFIHYDPDKRELSLIHVKGSGSDSDNRGISVTDYEVVVGQAVKNIRYLDRTNIADKLREGAGNQIASAVWLDGERQPDREGMISAIEEVGSNYSKKVIVFQPRVLQSKLSAVRQSIADGADNDIARRLKQLDALLLAARAECNGLGAEFSVVGDIS
ncbi:hypothetical protein GGD81_002401 [Rhodobium orientis]|uniref:Uncharacterized protein n=1 Tax=Rhodobium orientis TaxID=34017 RepID=A0A327JJ21_9HYPH|nr:hypothetical protein [Rhodobium orientis]MBB4303358.1 hypothetical protein [Rhodobium orientis]MBK5950293.1 hypothetical protein [Rhodobium orientis]RAI26407.1 hypothetical protein CH339_14465 [Rhodobium orientis]